MESQLENRAVTTSANSSVNLLDGLSAVGLVGGAIASFVTNNVSAAALPIAVAVGLQIKNRRDLSLEFSQKQEIAIAQVAQNINQHQAALMEYLQKIQQETHAKHTELRQIQEAGQKQLSQNLVTQGKELQQLIASLTQTTQALDSKHKDLEVVVGELRQMESASHIIEVNPKAEAYYQRGQSRQRLGDRAEALIDYTAAINLNGEYALAYYYRGVVHAELGHRKPSVEDLRQAAKLFFEQGDLDNYHRARDLGKEFYDLQHPFSGEDEQANLATSYSKGFVNKDQAMKSLAADDGITVGSLFD